MNIQMTPPRPVVFYVAVILAALALIGRLVAVPIVSPYAFALLLIAFLVLALAVVVRDW